MHCMQPHCTAYLCPLMRCAVRHHIRLCSLLRCTALCRSSKYKFALHFSKLLYAALAFYVAALHCTMLRYVIAEVDRAALETNVLD